MLISLLKQYSMYPNINIRTTNNKNVFCIMLTKPDGNTYISIFVYLNNAVKDSEFTAHYEKSDGSLSMAIKVPELTDENIKQLRMELDYVIKKSTVSKVYSNSASYIVYTRCISYVAVNKDVL